MSRRQRPGEDHYLLGDSAPEIEHLVNQAEVYALEAGQLLDRVGLSPGSAAVDVGCGVLGIMHLLCERVGPSGRVVGIDREARLLEFAKRVTQARGLKVELVPDDATHLSGPDEQFDLVHCRTLLLNVSNPRAVVSEMIRIARPSGVVVVQEPDAAGWVCDPPHDAFDTLRTELVNAYARAGKDFNIGRGICRLLRDAALDDVDVTQTGRVTKPGEFYHTFLLTLTGLVREEILAGGRLTPAEFNTLSANLREHLQEPGSLTGMATMWQAWGTKP